MKPTKELLEIQKMFCGCGSPDLAWAAIKDYLREREDWHEAVLNKKDFPHKYLETGKDYILAYLVDHFRLTEHGGSVGGCWLTKEGKEALTYLEMAFDACEDVNAEIEEHYEG